MCLSILILIKESQNFNILSLSEFKLINPLFLYEKMGVG